VNRQSAIGNMQFAFAKGFGEQVGNKFQAAQVNY
jgi:hypothetical protein